MRDIRESARMAPAIMCSAVASAIVLSFVMPATALRRLMDEGGPVENLSAVLYLVAIGAVWAGRNAGLRVAGALASTVVLLACLSREISLRKILTSHFADGRGELPFDATVWVLIIVVSAAAWLIVRHGASIASGLAPGRPLSVTFATLACALVASQLMDRLPRLTSELGYVLSEQSRLTALSIEEVLELTLPVLVIVAAFKPPFRVIGNRRADSAHSQERTLLARHGASDGEVRSNPQRDYDGF